MANADLRVKWIISPRSGSVYIPLRCPPFTRCLSSLCYELGSGWGSGGQQDKSSPVLSTRTPEPVGKSGVLTDSCEALWEGLLGPESWGTCISPGWGGVAPTGGGSWGESVVACQVEEALTSWKGRLGSDCIWFTLQKGSHWMSFGRGASCSSEIK